MPRYLLLMTEDDHFSKWEAADDELRARVYADFGAFAEAARARGAIVGGEALAPCSTARTVRAAPAGSVDRAPTTDGPYAESVEQLGGFYLIEAPDLATATELATLLPREYDVEVRECVDVPDF